MPKHGISSPNGVKTCWIAEVKAEMGLTRGLAPNRVSKTIRKVQTPEYIKPFIRKAIEKIRDLYGRIPTYQEIQREVLRLSKAKETPISDSTFGSIGKRLPVHLVKAIAHDKDLYYER